MIEFEVVGNPVAQARPRVSRFGGGVRMYDPAKVKDYKSYFKLCASRAAPKTLLDGPISVRLDVYVLKPKSWAKSRVHADTKPDADNFAKSALDAMEGVIYTNDSRIVSLQVEKYLSETPRCVVRIEEKK